MKTPAGIDEIYRPHEARIHETVFDTLSKPIHCKNKRTDRADKVSTTLDHRQRRGDGIHVTWRHFGQKTKFVLDPNEHDLFEALLRKVRNELTNIQGDLAFHDDDFREVLINCDRQIREAAAGRNNRLHIFTTLSRSASHHLAASEIGTLSASRPTSRAPQGSPISAANSSSPLLRAEEGQRCENFLGARKEAAVNNGTIAERQKIIESSSRGAQSASLAFPFWPTGELPIFFRSCWIGPNKFIYGGGWGWGGWGPIPSRKHWYCVVGGGRPPW